MSRDDALQAIAANDYLRACVPLVELNRSKLKAFYSRLREQGIVVTTYPKHTNPNGLQYVASVQGFRHEFTTEKEMLIFIAEQLPVSENL